MFNFVDLIHLTGRIRAMAAAKNNSLYSLFLIAGILFFTTETGATHLRAGEITVERKSCTSLSFTITVTVFTDTGSPIKFGEGKLNFGDGEISDTPSLPNILRPDLNPEIGFVQYTEDHVYGGPGRYVISYFELNRNEGILNIFNSVDTPFYLETIINIDPFLGCNNSPQLLVPPIDVACTGVAWLHNPGAFDPDGDSLSFELTIPKQNKGALVNGYRDPKKIDFYTLAGLDYDVSNEDKNAPPTFAIDARTGTLTWDAPGASGEYGIAFLIKEWRKVEGFWVLLGSVTRDMQIIVEDCENERPELIIPEDICVEAGTVITEAILGTDPDFNAVKIEAFSQVFSLPVSPARFEPAPPVFQPLRPPDFQAEQTFTWTTDCSHVKSQPYQVVFKITDRGARGGVNLVSFETWNITVVAPAPIWDDVQVGSTAHTADLTWDPYTCTNAETIQIWRRIDQVDFTPSECVVGMPDLGFTKIAELPPGDTSFTDDNNESGLTPGAHYCYRLLATFPNPLGGESYVSTERCLIIMADAPIVTHVTVDITDSSAGAVTVRWRSPFDADPIQYPPPYTFELYRSEEFTGVQNGIQVHPGRLSDSTFTDVGLNTRDNTYYYWVLAFDDNGAEVDFAVQASTVRLALSPNFREIILEWTADVPWTNSSYSYPRHWVYRGPEDATESQMVLIDSVEVTENSFLYADRGQYNSVPLSDTQTYCYRVMTKGTYGNPEIEAPLLNFSQITCVQPNDLQPPCKPVLTIQGSSCDDYFSSNPCSVSVFSNTLMWNRPGDPACREDTESYTIYMAPYEGAEFTVYQTNYKDTVFIDENLPSFARCYRVSAVDRSGNESELSEPFCFDNCPYYELPNVFTPNGDPCNQTFSAYSNRSVVGEEGESPCGVLSDPILQTRCARFVMNVRFSIFNRWGKEVYTYQSGGIRSIFIDWDGRDNSGKDLSAGIYFYSADVTFDVVNPAKREQTIKGWVQIIR